jgi:tripartite-type tricarboxylate transporter receptor subunit TctC
MGPVTTTCAALVALLLAGDTLAQIFVDRTTELGITGGGEHAAWGDVNGDGWPDLWMGGVLWINHEGKSFTRVDAPGAGVIADIDNDGVGDLVSLAPPGILRCVRDGTAEGGAMRCMPVPCFPADLPATVARGAAFDPLLGVTAAQYDGNKFNWIGSANDEVSVCVSWKDSGITSMQDLMTKELVVGGTGPTADTDQFPKVMNAILGTKMKLIPGYPGGNDVSMAMERGEVKGRCAWSWSSLVATRMSWYKDKTIHVLIQLALQKHPDLPDVPLIMDLAKNDQERAMMTLVFARQTMGRPFMAPPGVPADRVAALRKAFMETMKDTDFLAEAQKGQLEITPVSGEELQALVAKGYAVDPTIAKRVAEIIK